MLLVRVLNSRPIAILGHLAIATLLMSGGLQQLAWAQAAESPAANASTLPPHTPLAERTGSGSTHFALLQPEQTGVDFTLVWDPPEGTPTRGIGYVSAAGGVCIGDYDNDGLADLFLTRSSGGNRLYRNRGNFQFEDVTEAAGLDLELKHDAWGSGPCFVDIDNDGAARTSAPRVSSP